MTCSYCKKNPSIRKAAAGKLVICGPCLLVRMIKLREVLKSVDLDKAADWGIVDMDGRDNARALLTELDNLEPKP